MEIAIIAMKQIITMFLIMIIGIIIYRLGIISKDQNKGLSAVVLNVVNPAVIISSYMIDFDSKLLDGFLIAMGLSALSFVLTIIMSIILVRKKNNKDYNIERIALVYSNCGFIGIPLVSALVGSKGVFFLTAYLTMFNFLLWTHGVILMVGKTSPKDMVKNFISPCIIAVFVGFIIFMAQIKFPAPIANAVDYLGSMNTPLAMLTVGVTLAQTNIMGMFKKGRLIVISFYKMIVIPVVTVLVMYLFSLMGVEKDILQMIIISAACPVGASGTLFAIRYNGNEGYASETLGITTIISVITIPLTMLLSNVLI